ncbi:MAG: NAD(P)-dependent oxidoreductase [Sphaerochaetaceae bacterium]|jgi:3-hydroxyisobutyrate dehydrogenase|nr:NAD(P)-dependent oxidoreductase [Sphaerochaetaceae bacterium]MDD3942043.1 NAD(P)-dependent oxidoreductase [Sphaerochaetaceae bacterium]MDX9940240.1 NAD(P)-dependent oxidoreductase [Sphaerochaetaceae bacterium]
MEYKHEKPVVGWIGTGVMGRWMCEHVMPLASGVHVFNRTMEKASPLLAAGAIPADSVAAVARNATIIFTIVGHPADVEEVYFGPSGLIANAAPGTIFVDMTTTKPSLAKRIFRASVEAGCESIDAPVSGGDIGAREARLSIMAGGTEKAYATIEPFFAKMGKAYRLQGPPGSGQHTKMSNQIVVAGTMIGVCESLVYAKHANLDVSMMLSTIAKGAAACWALDNLAPRVLQGDFNPGFMIDHFVKDMGIALEEAKNMGIALPGLALVEQLYVALQGAGQGKLGTHALVLALERLSGH